MTDTEFDPVFMPEGKCARCGERESVLWESYIYKLPMQPETTAKLGFCGNDCHQAFEGGRLSISTLPDL